MAPGLLKGFQRSVASAPRANDDFYRSTLCRWIYNEDTQRARRVMRFNPDALANIAARAVNAQECVSFEKIAEGSTNRAFLLRFDNGSEAVARIQLPVVGNTHLVTASEVATMDFARTILGIPVPRVHAWSSEPTEVGADFIVCEKAPGMDLSQVWAQTGYEASHQVFHVSRQINIMEQKFLDNPLSSYGSVFYKKDIGGLPHEPLWPDGRQDKASEKFVIGPMMSQDFWRGERAKMEVDRGPWKHPATYVSALIKSEQEWLRRYARPRPTGDQFIRSDEDNSPGAHIELLDKLLSVIHALILGAEGSPTLGHPGLEKPNIFVSPTPPHDILGVVGWKTTTVRPMYLQVKFPKAMQYAGGLFQLNDKTEIPRLPDNFERLSLGEQANLMSHQWQAAVHVHHMSLIKKDVRHLMPLTHPYAPLFIHSIFRATRTWEDGMYGLKQALALIQFGWDVLADPGIPCPLAFSPEEIKSVEESTKRWEAYDHWVKSLSKELGVGCDGIVDDAEEFELVKRKSDEFQRRWDVATMGGPYPFQDGGRSVMV